MLRSSRRQRLRAVILGIGSLVIAIVVLAGLLRQRESSREPESHQHAVFQTIHLELT